MIARRQFITLLGGGAAAWPLAARAQQAAVPVIGSLQAISAAEGAGRMAAFRSGLGEIGFVDGRNIAIEYRWSDGQSDKLSALADDLVRRKVAVLVVGGSNVATRIAMSATKTIPIGHWSRFGANESVGDWAVPDYVLVVHVEISSQLGDQSLTH